MRPSREVLLMQHAQLEATRSTCSRLQVGAVISLDGRILVSGFNGAPMGMKHCDHSCDCLGTGPIVEGAEDGPRTHTSVCNSLQPCLVSVHAECNAIAFAARYGLATQGTDITTTDSPCLSCAQLIINAGIITATYNRPYRDSSPLDLLSAAGIRVNLLELPA